MATMLYMPHMKPKDWEVISKLPGNGNCIDCNAKYPEWGSVNFGILFCTRCCSMHRSLGPQVSQVRSVCFDNWTDQQLQRMRAGGNQSCKDWFAANGVPTSVFSYKTKYDNAVAQFYPQVLQARVDGKPEPKPITVLQPGNGCHKPMEWYQRLIRGGAASGKNQPRTKLTHRIIKTISSSEFFLFAYGMALVTWIFLYLAWRYL